MTNIFLINQTAGYIVTLILSFVIIIPISFHLSNFKGNCSLFTRGTFIEDDGRFEPDWASCFYCGWTLFVGIITLIASFVQIIRMIRFIKNGADSSFFSAFVDAILTLIITIIVLIDAILVTVGFAIWCNSVTQRFNSCQTASSVMVIGRNSGINPESFFIQLGSVQFGIWTSFVSWILLLVLASRKLFVYHERENIIVSMARERQRYQGMDQTDQGN